MYFQVSWYTSCKLLVVIFLLLCIKIFPWTRCIFHHLNNSRRIILWYSTTSDILSYDILKIGSPTESIKKNIFFFFNHPINIFFVSYLGIFPQFVLWFTRFAESRKRKHIGLTFGQTIHFLTLLEIFHFKFIIRIFSL